MPAAFSYALSNLVNTAMVLRRSSGSRDAGAAAVMAVCAVVVAARGGSGAVASGADAGAWPHDWGATARRGPGSGPLSPPRARLAAALRLRGSGPQDSGAAGKAPDDGAPIDTQAYADANLWVKRQMAALEERKKQVPRARSPSRFPRPARVRAAAARARAAPRGPAFGPRVRAPALTQGGRQQRRKELLDEEDGIETANVTNASSTCVDRV